MDQMDFSDIELQEKQAKVKALAADLDRRLKAVALTMERQTFATLNDKSYSYVSEILNTNNEDGQKPFQTKFVSSLIVEKPEVFKETIVDWLCDLIGYDHPKKKRSLTPEEELELYKKRVRDRGLEPLFNDMNI